jgi:hypothetical protein
MMRAPENFASLKHRLLFGQGSGHLGIDVGELRIPIRVAVALFGLAVALAGCNPPR